MSVVRRLLLADHPQETRFFAFIGVFGLVLAAIYWFATYELAGTVLLFGFGLAGAVAGIRLIVARPRRAARGAAGEEPLGSTQGLDRPFLDEAGRLPDETLAPLAVGLGVALALTAVVFGPWLLVAGVLPFAWGGWAWLTSARAELDAMDAADRAAGLGEPRPRLVRRR